MAERSELFERLEWLEFLERLEWLEVGRFQSVLDGTRCVSVVVSNAALHEPTDMLAVEAVDVKAAAALIRLQVSHKFPAPEVDLHSVVNGNIGGGSTLAVKQCDFLATRLHYRGQQDYCKYGSEEHGPNSPR